MIKENDPIAFISNDLIAMGIWLPSNETQKKFIMRQAGKMIKGLRKKLKVAEPTAPKNGSFQRSKALGKQISW